MKNITVYLDSSYKDETERENALVKAKEALKDAEVSANVELNHDSEFGRLVIETESSLNRFQIGEILSASVAFTSIQDNEDESEIHMMGVIDTPPGE